jgi:hypothetical protein
MDDPCSVSDRTWFVTLYDCEGRVFSWCGRRYVLIPAPCGHLQLDVPPGCYYLKAVWSFRVITPGLVFRVNHFTDAAIVTACCDQTTCIKLFNPSAHRCGTIYARAVNDLVQQQAVPAALGRQALNLTGEINEQIGPPERDFELGHLDEIDAFMEDQAKKTKKKKH